MNDNPNMTPEGSLGDSTSVVHQQNDDVHTIYVNALRVLIIQDEDSWFAHGLELDYAAAGHDLEDVKHRFVTGLAGTITEHLKIYGTIEHILKVAPQDVWNLWLNAEKQYSLDTASLHDLRESVQAESWQLPFSGIAYLEPDTAYATAT